MNNMHYGYVWTLHLWNFSLALRCDRIEPFRWALIPGTWSWRRPRLHRWLHRQAKRIEDACWWLHQYVTDVAYENHVYVKITGHTCDGKYYGRVVRPWRYWLSRLIGGGERYAVRRPTG